MDQPDSQIQPYALKAGEGWTYRFGIDFTVKAGELRESGGWGGCIADLESGHGELVAKPQLSES